MSARPRVVLEADTKSGYFVRVDGELSKYTFTYLGARYVAWRATRRQRLVAKWNEAHS